MKMIAVVTLLIAQSANAQEAESLEADMADGHAAVLEHEEAQAAPEATVTATAPEPTIPRPMHREGFTFELGLGLGGTNDYVDHSDQLARVFEASVGGFLNERTALLLHITGSSNSKSYDTTVGGSEAARNHGISSYFAGPQLQWFPIDRLMLAFGVGAIARVDLVTVNVHGTTTGDSFDWKTTGGVGASARAAFTVYQRQDAAAIRVGVEALPSYVGHDWHTAVALMAELQSF